MGNPGQQVKKLRNFFGLTQEEFANTVSTKRNSISMIESGRNKPTFELIADICEVFNLTADYFLSDDNPAAFKEDFKYITIKRKDIKNVIDGIDDFLNDSKNSLQHTEESNKSETYSKLQKLCENALLYLDFHLTVINLNLKLSKSALLGEKFDLSDYEERSNDTKTLISGLKKLLNTETAKEATLLDGLIKLDEAIRVYLDGVKDLSKDIYLRLPKDK